MLMSYSDMPKLFFSTSLSWSFNSVRVDLSIQPTGVVCVYFCLV
jgi:hypothetical protein